MKKRMNCNQCEALMINGVFCHETGCPNTHKDYDKETGEWVTPEEDDPEERYYAGHVTWLERHSDHGEDY